jgi:hypothetical protein
MWLKTKPTNLLRNVMPRPLANIASLCAALYLAFSTYFVGYVVVWNRTPNIGKIEEAFKALYVQNILLLTSVGIVLFALFGFYTHARTYQNRYVI